MQELKEKIAWITGAGSGIGEASALALARAGATVVVTGRRKEPLDGVAARITAEGGTALALTGDLTEPAAARNIAARIGNDFGRLDILVNNAGVNITERMWSQLSAEGARQLIDGNLTSAFSCVAAALPLMLPQKDGLLIHIASMSGRFIGLMAGPGYTAAKHGLVAMSHSLNMEECVNGIRSTVICPGEVATPILDKRPVPVSREDRERMLQSADVADIVLYVAGLPKRVCMNEVQITPTWNRGYVALRTQAHIKV